MKLDAREGIYTLKKRGRGNTCRGRLFLNLVVTDRTLTPFWRHTISAAIRQRPPRLISSPLPPSFASRYARPSIGQVLQACSASRLHLSAILYPPIRSLWQVPSRPSVGVQSWQARQGKRPADWSQMRNDHREAPLLSRLFLESSMTYHSHSP